MDYTGMLDRLLELAKEEGSAGLTTGRICYSDEYEELYDQLFKVLMKQEDNEN